MCSSEERDDLGFDAPEAEFAAGGEGLAEEVPGSVRVARLAAGEEHAGPLETRAGE